VNGRLVTFVKSIISLFALQLLLAAFRKGGAQAIELAEHRRKDKAEAEKRRQDALRKKKAEQELAEKEAKITELTDAEAEKLQAELDGKK
jgi:Nuclear distribution C domain